MVFFEACRPADVPPTAIGASLNPVRVLLNFGGLFVKSRLPRSMRLLGVPQLLSFPSSLRCESKCFVPFPPEVWCCNSTQASGWKFGSAVRDRFACAAPWADRPAELSSKWRLARCGAPRLSVSWSGAFPWHGSATVPHALKIYESWARSSLYWQTSWEPSTATCRRYWACSRFWPLVVLSGAEPPQSSHGHLLTLFLLRWHLLTLFLLPRHRFWSVRELISRGAPRRARERTPSPYVRPRGSARWHHRPAC